MKGISPMLATILLIAFTVAVGGIISLWLTTFTRTQTTQVTGTTEDQIRCQGSSLSLTVAKNSTPTANTSVTVSYDIGTLTLSGPVMYVTCGTTIKGYKTSSSSISPGSVIVMEANTSTCTDSISTVRVTLNCTGPATGTVYKVITECKAGGGCGI